MVFLCCSDGVQACQGGCWWSGVTVMWQQWVGIMDGGGGGWGRRRVVVCWCPNWALVFSDAQFGWWPWDTEYNEVMLVSFNACLVWSWTIPGKCDDQWHALWQCHMANFLRHFVLSTSPIQSIFCYEFDGIKWMNPLREFYMGELYLLFQPSGKAVVTCPPNRERAYFWPPPFQMAQNCKWCSSVISPPIYMKKNAPELYK